MWLGCLAGWVSASVFLDRVQIVADILVSAPQSLVFVRS